MARRLPLAQISKLVGLASDVLKSIEPRSEQRRIVDAYLHAVRRANYLAAKSKMNKRRGWTNIADRQKTRSEGFQDHAATLLPMVEDIIEAANAAANECPVEPEPERSPAEALSVIAATRGIFDEPDEGDEG